MSSQPIDTSLVSTVRALALRFSGSVAPEIQFTDLSWEDSILIGLGIDAATEFDVSLEFVEPPDLIYHMCTLCGEGRSWCKHAIALLVKMHESKMDQRIEDNGYLPTELSFKAKAPKPDKKDRWKTQLNQLAELGRYSPSLESKPAQFPAGRELIYVIEWQVYNRDDQTLNIVVGTRPSAEQPANGLKDYGKLLREFHGGIRVWMLSPDPLDRELAASVSMVADENQPGIRGSRFNFRLSLETPATMLKRLAKSGRLYRNTGYGFSENMPLVGWLDDEPFEPRFQVTNVDEKHVQLALCVTNSTSVIAHGDLSAVRKRCFLDSQNRLGLFSRPVRYELFDRLRDEKPIVIPREAAGEMMKHLSKLSGHIGVTFVDCDDIRPAEVIATPRGRIHIKAGPYRRDQLEAEVHFDYDGILVPLGQEVGQVYDDKRHALVQVDREFQRDSRQLLNSVGVKVRSTYSGTQVTLAQKNLARAVARLIQAGWHVEADGKLYRTGTKFEMKVVSGVDWFELQGKADFGGSVIDLPRLLQSLKAGQQTVVLDDGSVGMIPEQWLKKFGSLSELGTSDDGAVKFGRAQVGLLDALLAEQGEVNVDEQFAAAREKLRLFDQIHPQDPPAGFIGELRPYQKLSQGWFEFLRNLGFGGCLADDMGLGKTIQVLAMLEQRREQNAGPSLIVVPRSLIFNWTAEAKKFAPQMRVLDQSHSQRVRGIEHLSEYDLVLTTYGTLRRDAAFLKDFEFDYVILDEAQAIKNATTEASKAARLLRGNHRLALSGTPIENHLGELWSLFDFLNPGMLGRVGRFAGYAKDADMDERQLLASAVRPFILRRTKKQVAPELPDRVEQTVVVELDAEQRKSYDELRAHYQQTLLKKIDTDGIGKSQIVILEALLRLRQAACHPGLIDKARIDEPSAKLDELIDRLSNAIEAGERVLVFSQFTSLLAIVKKRVKALNVEMLYLDGKTKNRQALVEQFQTGTGPAVFLISLKAGGVGLNLTAARNVYLLDPWWNPAVEAQAIDRVHRIGQKQTVFATRLIAANTVEQKVLELQAKKKDLADAIVNADNAGISSLTRDDVALLLA